MNGRKLYREYLCKEKHLDCQEFILMESDWYEVYDVYYKDSCGTEKKTSITHKPFVDWVIKSFSNSVWESYKL